MPTADKSTATVEDANSHSNEMAILKKKIELIALQIETQKTKIDCLKGNVEYLQSRICKEGSTKPSSQLELRKMETKLKNARNFIKVQMQIDEQGELPLLNDSDV